tara:strand:- start:110 stop:703 length:594 start_codon:yes stop_codon:yes gene_type:complete
MIDFNTKDMQIPFHKFIKYYNDAAALDQPNIEAACLSTVSNNLKPHARFINIKYINNNELIFFSNYTSDKANNIKLNKNVALTFYWSLANIQIRIEGTIKKLSSIRSDNHWKNRSKYKNALAISSDQSSLSKSYQEILDNYEYTLENSDLLHRPSFWGGYVIKPSYFEFWTGHKSRINKRKIFKKNGLNWSEYFLQP